MADTLSLEEPKLLKGSQMFPLTFEKHNVCVSVTVSEFSMDGKTCLKSHTRCEPCCNNVSNVEINQRINDLHMKAFGAGGWIYTNRDCLPPTGSCEGRSQGLADVLGGQVQTWKAQFNSWKQKSEELYGKSNKASTSEKRKLKEDFTALRSELEVLQRVTGQERPAKRPKKRRRRVQGDPEVQEEPEKTDSQSALDKLEKDLQDAKTLERLVRQVQEGVAALKNPPVSPISSTEDRFDEFVEYRQRQLRQQDDNGGGLVRVLQKVAKAARSGARDETMTGVVCSFISHLVEHLRWRQDPSYSKTGEFDREKRAKRTHEAAVVICKIVDGLWEHKKAEALVVFNALLFEGYNITRPIRDMSRVRRDAFVSSAISRLARLDLRVPGQTRLFHPAALVYWALAGMRLEFATVCDLVELKKFSAVDLSPKIDGLAEGWQSSDIPFAMTIPISEFEDMFQAEIDPRGPPTAATTAAHSKDDDSASTPGDGASQTNDEQQHHSAQSPGFYHPGSMRAALSSYDSITVPVDSEPNAGNGEADSRCHGRESATSMCDAQGSQTAHVESAAVDGLRCSSPFNIGTNSPPATETASRGWEESRATIFQSINANGMTTSKDQEADELYQSTSGGVLAAREASSLYLLADAAGRGREERRYAEVAPISGPDRGGQSTSSRPNKDQKMGQVATVHSNLGATLSLAIPPSRLGTETQLPSASGSQPGQLHSPAGFSGSSPSETQSPSPLEQVLSERSQERVSHCGLWPNSLPDVIPCGNYISDEALLMSIFRERIYSTRTLLEENSYRIPLVMADGSTEVKAAALYLASTYARHLHNWEVMEGTYGRRLAGALQDSLKNLAASNDVLVTTGMLLIHHKVVNGDRGWVGIGKILTALQKGGIPFHHNPSALFIAYQIVLGIFDHREHVHGGMDINWLRTRALPDHVLDLGLSSRLLYLIGRITEMATSIDAAVPQEAASLLAMIQRADQLVSGVEGEAKRVVETIALSYQHAGIIMLYCRLFGYTRKHPVISSRARDLASIIMQLPSHGNRLYRAMDPLFSMVVCAMVAELTDTEEILDRMRRIHTGGINNVYKASSLLRWLLQWQDSHITWDVQHGWFEEMRMSLPEEHRDVSLG